MRSMRQRLAAVTLIGGLTTLGLGLSAGPANAAAVDLECPAYIGDAQSGSLHMTALPSGPSVPAGSNITVTASWDEDDFDEVDRLYICGSVDGFYSASMSMFRVGLDENDPSMTLSTLVPANLPVGSEVCVVAALEGRGELPDRDPVEMVSETVCYRSAAAVTTTTTTAAPTTTTTVAPQVEVQPEETGSGAGTNTAPAVEAAPVVEGEVAANPAPAVELPRTGEALDLLAGFGAAAVALGGLARIIGRKRTTK